MSVIALVFFQLLTVVNPSLRDQYWSVLGWIVLVIGFFPGLVRTKLPALLGIGGPTRKILVFTPGALALVLAVASFLLALVVFVVAQVGPFDVSVPGMLYFMLPLVWLPQVAMVWLLSAPLPPSLATGENASGAVALFAEGNNAADPQRDELHPVNVPADARFNIVFIHGVDGHWQNTWRSSAGDDHDWTRWVARGFPQAAVWSLHYNAATLVWRGSTMPLSFRARNVLDLFDNKELFRLPTVFIVHSFGGLVIKQLWRFAQDSGRQDVKQSIRGVIFIATPHFGSLLANYLDNIFLKLPARPTITVKDLEYSAPSLLDLNDWYRDHPVPRNYVYFETQPTKLFGSIDLVQVVDAVSADPGLSSTVLRWKVAITADHITICKPRDPGDQIAESVNRALKEIEESLLSLKGFDAAAVVEVVEHLANRVPSASEPPASDASNRVTGSGDRAPTKVAATPSRELPVAAQTASVPPGSPTAAPLPQQTGGDQGAGSPVIMFISYSHRDEKLREELETHLSILRRQGTIAAWNDRKIAAGQEWKGEIDRNLELAQIILLLISPSFVASDYCYDIEMKRALERHEQRDARVIPVILRPVDWKGAPFSKLQALPKDAKPVASWKNRDEAFKNVAEGIRKVAEEIARKKADKSN
jgi:hypothetical protein